MDLKGNPTESRPERHDSYNVKTDGMAVEYSVKGTYVRVSKEMKIASLLQLCMSYLLFGNHFLA